MFDARITHELKFICVDKEKVHNVSEDLMYIASFLTEKI